MQFVRNNMRRLLLGLCLGTLAACGAAPERAPGSALQAQAVSAQAEATSPYLVAPLESTDPSIDPRDEAELGARSEWQLFLDSPSYTGAVVAKFTDASGVALHADELHSSLESVAPLLRELSQYGTPEPFLAIEPALIDRARERARQDGWEMTNWHRVLTFVERDPVRAGALLSLLEAHGDVEWAHPIMTPGRTDAGISDTPDLSSDQSYLSADNGGLNIEAAWDLGLTGAGQQLYHVEGGWNYEHEDLSINAVTTPVNGNYFFNGYQSALDHGTAMLGVINAQHNAYGVRGVAPETTLYTSGVEHVGVEVGGEVLQTTLNTWFQGYEDIVIQYAQGGAVGGQVLLTALGNPSTKTLELIQSGALDSVTNLPGDIPVESWPAIFEFFQDLVQMGVVPVVAAGNGGISMDDASVKLLACPNCMNFVDHDSGTLMVGASNGPSLERSPGSTCGERVNVFAWGEGVTTTGYGDYGMQPLVKVNDYEFCYPAAWLELDSAALNDKLLTYVCPEVAGFCAGQIVSQEKVYHCPNGYQLLAEDPVQQAADFTYLWDNDPNTPELDVSDPNQWYTERFGGTSSASAIIAGMVVLVQEHVDNLYANQIHPWEDVYLNAAQVRALFTHPEVGTAQSDGGCNIGMQPDLGKALQLLDAGIYKPKIVTKGSLCDNDLSSECVTTCSVDPLNPDANCGRICDMNPTHELCAQWCVANLDAKTVNFDLAGDCKAPVVPLADLHDYDGDGRADIIAWSDVEQRWYVDRSGSNVSNSADGFGDWDVVFDVADQALAPGRRFPVVQDYNSDGRVDLALYNTDTGHWRIKYTQPEMLSNDLIIGNFSSWDLDIDYSGAEHWLPGSRPMPGDYDARDVVASNAPGSFGVGKTIDRALVTPGGHWLYDFVHTVDESDGTIPSEHIVKFLTDEQLATAPGWAYLPVPYSSYSSQFLLAAFLSPDSDEAGQKLFSEETSSLQGVPITFVGHEGDIEGQGSVMTAGNFGAPGVEYVLRHVDAAWSKVKVGYNTVSLEGKQGYSNFGNSSCMPIPADYDGDAIDDLAVLCPDGDWKIVYSSGDPVEVTTIHYASNNVLPACIYPGGIDYQEIITTFAPLNFGCPETEQCTIFDLPPPTGPRFVQCMHTAGSDSLECLEQ